MSQPSRLRIGVLSAVVLALSSFACAQARAAEQRKDEGWCTISAPDAVRPGERFAVGVCYRDLPGGTHLHCDLKDEKHAMVQWRPPKVVSGTGEAAFDCTAPQGGDAKAVYALIYASKDGSFDTQLHLAASPLVAVAEAAPVADRPGPRAYTGKSWVAIIPNYPASAREGDAFEITAEFFLDASEAVDGKYAYLLFAGLGPWNDEAKFHVSYPGVGGSARIEVGSGRHTFRFTCPTPKAEDVSGVDGITPAVFIYSDEADPWGSKFGVETRGGFVAFLNRSKRLSLDSHREGNLFTYGEDVAVEATVRQLGGMAGRQMEVRYSLYSHRGDVVATGSVPFTPGAEEERLTLKPQPKERGIFLLEAEVPGFDRETLTFATIPDLPALMQGRPSRFGMCDLATAGTLADNERNCRIAQKLGISYSRSWVYWRDIEPGPGEERWQGWDNAFSAARGNGIGMNALLFGVPAWAQRHPRGVDWNYDPPEWDAWERFCGRVAERYRGNGLYSVEFWNEPCPDGWWHDSAEALAKLHELGNRAVKAVAPEVVTTMSGGVFPQSQYVALLAAGGGEHVDAVPVHYGNGETVELYRAGLKQVGLDKPIWDNETGRLSASFGKPRLADVTDLTQANWVPRQWTDELAHGCEKIFYFSWMDSGGNWACYYPDGTPRPSVPVLAVYVSKLFDSQYRGRFRVGPGGIAHVFERNGKPVVVTWSDADEQVSLPVGAERVTVTDIFGNEQDLPAPGGVASVRLLEGGRRGQARYVEGADLSVLLALTAAELSPSETVMIQGEQKDLSVSIANPFAEPISGTLGVQVPAGWPAVPDAAFAVAPGAKTSVPYTLAVPTAADKGRHTLRATVQFSRADLPACVRELMVTVISRDMVGNLVPNGDFERLVAGAAEGWSLDGTHQMLREEALFGRVNRFLRLEAHGEQYVHAARAVQATPGQKYLYSAWMRSQKMAGGSNLFESYLDGRTNNLTNMSVFAFSGNPFWELYTKVYEAPAGIKDVACVPVGGGEGYAEFDNVRLTTYEGTPYAAECPRLSGPVRIDGDLADWSPDCPIPLLGPSQLTKLQEGYSWSPRNLSGVAYVRWDEANLYVAAWVQDDAQVNPADPTAGDALVIGLDPSFRGADAANVAFPLYVAGSADRWQTLWLPKEFGGPARKTGNLSRDGASTEVAVRRVEGATVYEALIPLHYLDPLRPALGRKVGFSVRLMDNDGAGPAGALSWGGGLGRKLLPDEFGCLTFTE